MAFNYFDNSSILGGHVRSGTLGINSVDSNRIHGTPIAGGALFTTVGSHTWVAPPGVTSVCVVCIGGGGGGMYYNSPSAGDTFAMSGGGGGALAYLNDYPVVPGQSYTVVVGAGGSAGAYPSFSTAGGESWAFGFSICMALGGNPGRYAADVASAGYSISSAYGTFGHGSGGGTARGAGANSGYGPCGGGGAGGYEGVGFGSRGGTGRDDFVASGDNGLGGSGAGGGASSVAALEDHVSGGGGGTGVYGAGASGIASTDGWGGGGSGGEGGGTAYHGAPGGPPVAGQPSSQDGGKYGGGGGGQSHNVSMGQDAGDGAQGAVRIIWGEGRAFPITKVSLADSLAGETEY